jgi:hypothetical protein
MLLFKNSNNIIFDSLLIMIIIPFITNIIDNLKIKITNYFETTNNSCKTVEITGYEYIRNGIYSFQYPIPMTAVCYFLIKNNKLKHIKFYEKLMNGTIYYEDNLKQSSELNFIMNYQEIYYNDIEIKFQSEKIESEKNEQNYLIWKSDMILKTKKDMNSIVIFIEECIKEYKIHLNNVNKNKIYHFIYQGSDTYNKSNWKGNIMSDLNDDSNRNFETFDHLYSPHKEMFINDIKQLKDVDFYKNTGARRKKSYLLYGKPGTGKTSSVIMMANYDKRHILEIPMSRIKTNADIEEILNIKCINNIPFKNDEIILLFDEIDCGLGKIIKNKTTNKIKSDDNKSDDNKITVVTNDSINLGTILSRLDGINSYNGIIIIATTNNLHKLPPSIYRHGRLNPIKFNYMEIKYIINMIEDFYKIKLNDDQIKELSIYDNKIAPSSLRYFLENNRDNLSNLIDKLKLIN